MLENFGIKDIIDILLVAIVLYKIYNLLKQSGSKAIFNGIIAFLILWIIVSQILDMRLLGSILDKFINVGLLIIIILFQDEIRRFLINLGTNNALYLLANLFGIKKQPTIEEENITSIVLACLNLSRSKIGALIVIQQNIPLSLYEKNGEMLNAEISTRLIENVFFKNSPLHDGAMIIANGKIEAAGCILPISEKSNLPKRMGLRHRAALGITEETDAIAIAVSEETGRISYARKDELHSNVTPESLQEILTKAFLKKNKKKSSSKEEGSK